MLAGHEHNGELRSGYWVPAGNHKGNNTMSDLNVDNMTMLKRDLKEN
jgi:hypothetical protein